MNKNAAVTYITCNIYILICGYFSAVTNIVDVTPIEIRCRNLGHVSR